MSNIKLIKDEKGFGYQYTIIGSDNKKRYVKKSGFKTPNEAYKAAEKSYNDKLNNGYTDKNNPIKIKKLNLSTFGMYLLNTVITGGLVFTVVSGGIKLQRELKEILPEITKRDFLVDDYNNTIIEITEKDCDFSNLHIIIRTAKTEVNGVAAVTCDQLTRLGVSNEIINKDSDIAYKISNAIATHPDDDIVLINLETELENEDSQQTIIMGDSSNRREYSSDVLISCLNTSLKQYNVDPIIRSGEATGNGWRLDSYIEIELNNAVLIDNISQFTIDLPITVSEDEIIRNDCASAIVEGIMRWCTIDHNDRYENIYYTAKYGETLQSISAIFDTSSIILQNNSDINIYKELNVGDTVTVGLIPEAAEYNVNVNNPYTTSDINSIEPIIYEYIVESGDTLTSIANNYGVKIEDIMTESGDPNNIRIGETLYISTYNLYETDEKINLLDVKEKTI
ncbi:MAG: LysM peptidoglycan-binding domain-containing protein [Bacilli bacterium]|nr:LysM peptidoglycan-binding domain-containing protein [Bacilli bacterium]